MENNQLAYLQAVQNRNTVYDLAQSSDRVPIIDKNTRKVYIARHSERVDFTFGRWIPHCFDGEGNYIRKDLNMPKHLPERNNGPDSWLLDSPITNIGIYQARLTGDALKDIGADISYAYCSPSYRCVQTCHGILEGLGLTHIKIRVEFALFEWMTWYQDNTPEWLTKEELQNDNFNIDMEYEPMITGDDLKRIAKESAEELYRRNHSVVETFLKSHASGNVLMVGHSCTLDTCSRLLIGRNPRTRQELAGLLPKIPFCSVVAVEQSSSTNEWNLTDPCCFSVTHNKNARFDWRVINEL